MIRLGMNTVLIGGVAAGVSYGAGKLLSTIFL
jgi:hypothetical protein